MAKNNLIKELHEKRIRLRKCISMFMAEKDYEKCKPLLIEIDSLAVSIVELEKMIKES